MANSGIFSADGTAVADARGYNSTGSLNTLYLAGTWGSGSVTIQGSPDDGVTYVTIPNYTYTANAVINLGFRWTKLKLTLAGSTNPSLKWWVL